MYAIRSYYDLEKMLKDKPGNVMVTAGNNAKKTDYILQSVRITSYNVCYTKLLRFSALGHAPEFYDDPIFRAHIRGGILWVLGVE